RHDAAAQELVALRLAREIEQVLGMAVEPAGDDCHCLRQHALAACSLEGARRNSGFQGTSLLTLVQMAANGLGVTLVPDMAMQAGILRGLNLVARPLEGDSPPRVIALAWRLTSSRKAMFRELGAVLRGALREGGGEKRVTPRRPREKTLP
uniref:LysR substrate-binding domain-containing protein n=1 Tax=Rhodoblastus sp. TaxID=1962975 RepID=UPI003F955CB3